MRNYFTSWATVSFSNRTNPFTYAVKRSWWKWLFWGNVISILNFGYWRQCLCLYPVRRNFEYLKAWRLISCAVICFNWFTSQPNRYAHRLYSHAIVTMWGTKVKQCKVYFIPQRYIDLPCCCKLLSARVECHTGSLLWVWGYHNVENSAWFLSEENASNRTKI